jgi:ferredoxin
MRVHVDRSKCAGIGICESLAPDMFEVDEAGQLQLLQGDNVPAGAEEAAEEAIQSCPTGALSRAP